MVFSSSHVVIFTKTAKHVVNFTMAYENVRIDRFSHYKLTDFCLCDLIGKGESMKTSFRSLCYCASECMCNDLVSDVWSTGVIMYAMVTGKYTWNLSKTKLIIQRKWKNRTQPQQKFSRLKKEIWNMRVHENTPNMIEWEVKRTWFVKKMKN